MTPVLQLLHDLQGSCDRFWPSRLTFLTREGHMFFLMRLAIAAALMRQQSFMAFHLALMTAERDYYKARAGDKRPTFTLEWRKRFADIGAAMGWDRLEGLITVARARTVKRWHLAIAAGKALAAKTGRPRTAAETEALVLKMAQENVGWGTRRIVGELRKLDIRIHHKTVSAIFKRNGLPTDPERRKATESWKPFLEKNWQHLVATDFFTHNVWTWFGRKTYYCLFNIHLASRRVEVVGICTNPDETFMTQIARNMTMADSWMESVGGKYLIHDRDGKFSAAWKNVLNSAGVEAVPIPPRSPNLNPFAERWVRIVKTEIMRRINIFGEDQLRSTLREYLAHYHEERPHQGLGNNLISGAAKVIPGPGAVGPRLIGPVRCRERLGGLLKSYYRDAA